MITATAFSENDEYERYLLIRQMDEETLDQARVIFDEYHRRGILRNENMEDGEWIIDDERTFRVLKFNLSEIEYRQHMYRWSECPYVDFIRTVKAYLLFRFGISGMTKLYDLCNELISLGRMDEEEVLSYRKDISHLIAFLEILPGNEEKIGELVEDLEEAAWRDAVENRNRHRRQLVDFSSYLRFHQLLSEYWESASQEEKLVYFPVFLWWKLTMVLPLRPGELLLTPRDCVRRINGNSYILVRRSLLKGSQKVTYRLDTDYEICEYPIPEWLASEIQWYQKASEYLPEPEIPVLFRRKKPNNKQITRFTYPAFSVLLDKFYREIHAEENGVSRICPGDTRHIAMMNLIISGGSPTVCKELAGHEDIAISSHYYTNFASLIECAVFEEYRSQHSVKPMVQISQKICAILPASGTEVENGICQSEKYRNHDVNDCVQSVGPDGQIGYCPSCRYYVSKTGLSIDFFDCKTAKKNVQADGWFLMQMLELVRKGLGYEENLQTAVLHLQNSCYHYKECLEIAYRNGGGIYWPDLKSLVQK